MDELNKSLPPLMPLVDSAVSCADNQSSCAGESEHSHDHEVDADSRDGHTDGAGEPCPTPLMWQEVRENYLRDSVPWEMMRGPHRLVGRTWGEGPPLYFLNNFAATAELYSLIAWLLRDHCRCVVFDAVTNDRRAARQSKPSMSEFAEDLFLVADRLGDQVFPIYGAGFGAAVALQAAMERPDRVQGMILQHGFARRQLSFFERMLASLCLRSGQTLNELPQRRRFQAVNHRPWFPPFDLARFDFLIQSTGTLPLRDLARRALAIKSFDIISRLHTVRCPVMLLRTEGEGRLAAESQTILEQGLTKPRIEWMHSAGQHPCLTHPHRVAKTIDSFLQTLLP